MAAKTANKWLTSAKDRQNIQYILSIDTTDDTLQEYKELMPNDVEYVISDNKTAIQAINNAALRAENDLFIVVSDDFDCMYHWDAALIEALDGKSDFVVKTDDGAQPWIITLPIMDKVYYQRFGYIYNPEYKHMFCDTEMTHVGELLNKKIHLPLVFRHNHYTSGAMTKDAINEKNDSTWAQGESIYLKRVMSNFDLPEELKKNYIGHYTHNHWLASKGVCC